MWLLYNNNNNNNNNSRTDGKRPDGATQIPWSSGKSLIWDVTVTDKLAASNISLSSAAPGESAENAANKKVTKYALLSNQYIFQPITFETLGLVNCSAAEIVSGYPTVQYSLPTWNL